MAPRRLRSVHDPLSLITTTGHVVTDEGSPGKASPTTRHEKTPQPKPINQCDSKLKECKDLEKSECDIKMKEYNDLLKSISEIIDKNDLSMNGTILDALEGAGSTLQSENKSRYWRAEVGQAELLRQIDECSRKLPPSGLHILDYSEASRAMRKSSGASAGE